MKDILVYLDVDGVGSHWLKYMEALLPDNLNMAIVNKAPNRGEILRSVYQDNPHFFALLEPYHPYGSLIATLKTLGVTLRILTARGNDHPNPQTVIDDKLYWLNKHFDVDRRHVYVVAESKDKAAWAKPNAILIDDYDRNCDEWVAAGGHAIQVDDCKWVLDEVLSRLHKAIDEITKSGN